MGCLSSRGLLVAEGLPFWDLKPNQAIIIETPSEGEDCYEEIPGSIASWYSPAIRSDVVVMASALSSPHLPTVMRVRNDSEEPLLL